MLVYDTVELIKACLNMFSGLGKPSIKLTLLLSGLRLLSQFSSLKI